MLGLVEVVTAKAAGGLTYAVLIAGIAEAIGGAIAIGRGDTYLGSIAFKAWTLAGALGLILILFAVLGISYLDGSSSLAKLAG